MEKSKKASADKRKVVRAACPHDCPDTCALVVEVENGRAVSVKGAADHPVTDGFICSKVNRYLERTYNSERILYPMKSIGAKGQGLFTRISWDEAIETIAARFKEIASEFGQEAILPYSCAGTLGLIQGGSMGCRFFNRLGASQLKGTLCSSAGFEGYELTTGSTLGTDMEKFAGAKLILIWGANPITSSVHLWRKIMAAKQKGARLIAIDPYRSRTAEKCDEHLALLPGTDAALALAMMHVIISEGIHDRDYVEKYTLGFESLKKHVEDWTPESAAAITGLGAEAIVKLAREYATTKPAVIRINYGMQRHAGGGMAVRTVTCLPALVGAWRHASGGILLSSSSVFQINTAELEGRHLMQGNPRSINAAAIGDALAGFDRRVIYHKSENGAYPFLEQVLSPLEPPVKALYVYNSNPVAVAPESAKVIDGFKRNDLFTVVHEIFQTDTADYADILLPATTQLEQFDIHTSYGHLYMAANNQAIEPLGEARANTEVFRLLAEKMGFSEPCFKDSDEALARQALSLSSGIMKGIDLDELREKGFQRLNLPDNFAPFSEGNFATPSGRCEFYSERAAARGLDPLPVYLPPAESAQTDPELAERFPLVLISPSAQGFLNSSFANLPSMLRLEKQPYLEINPTDADPRFIGDGDEVRILNRRGEFRAQARVSARTRPGVVVAPSLWWKKLGGQSGNANDVTSQNLADLGEAATYYDTLVDVIKRI